MQLDLGEIKARSLARIPAKGRQAAGTATGQVPGWPAGPRPARGASWVRGGAGEAALSRARGGGGGRAAARAGLAQRGPLRSAPAGMAGLLTSGPPPDEQDFIQAYEEVREKYKGTEPLAPDPPSECARGRGGTSRLASLTAGRVASCCPRPTDRCPNRVQSVAASFTSLVRSLWLLGPREGMDALH